MGTHFDLARDCYGRDVRETKAATVSGVGGDSYPRSGGDNTQGAAAMVLSNLAPDPGPALFAPDPLTIPASPQLSKMTYGLQKSGHIQNDYTRVNIKDLSLNNTNKK